EGIAIVAANAREVATIVRLDPELARFHRALPHREIGVGGFDVVRKVFFVRRWHPRRDQRALLRLEAGERLIPTGLTALTVVRDDRDVFMQSFVRGTRLAVVVVDLIATADEDGVDVRIVGLKAPEARIRHALTVGAEAEVDRAVALHVARVFA